MLRNKWITLAIIFFVGYSYFNKQMREKNIPSPAKNADLTAHEISKMPKEKSELSSNNSTNLNNPSNKPLETNPTHQNAATKQDMHFSGSNNPGFVEKKVISIMNNLLDTEKGKEVLEKILSSPQILANGDQQEIDPYFNKMSRDIEIGEGKAAICGQSAAIDYMLKLTDGQIIKEANENKPETIILGHGDVITGIDLAIIGMKKNGLKATLLTPSQAFDSSKFKREDIGKTKFVSLEVKLKDIKPNLPESFYQMQIFNRSLGDRSKISKCGDIVSLHYKIKKIDGTLIYDSAIKEIPKIFSIGSRDVPFAINAIAENSGISSAKTAIVPLATLKNILGKETDFFPQNIILPKNELVILEAKINIQ